MMPYAIIFVLAAMGVNETMYLLRSRIAKRSLVCPIGKDCHTVMDSKYSRIFVLPLDVWGLLFYSTIALSCGLAVVGIGTEVFWTPFIQLVVALGSVLSLFFTYLQWRVIRAWCFWCLTSAFTVWTMGVIILLSKVF